MRHGLVGLIYFVLTVCLAAPSAWAAQSSRAPLDVSIGSIGSLAALPATAAPSVLNAGSLEVASVGNEVDEFEDEPNTTPTAVPEPSGCALFGFGILFMLYLIRRRHAAMAS